MNIHELRAEVRKRQQAANAKARRLKAKGIDITDTKSDPRRDPTRLKTYNRNQLTSYLNELNQFTARTNQFVPLSGGNFVTAQEWRKYRNAERKYNAISQREYSKVADLKLPNTGMTVSERDATMRPTNTKIRRAQGEAVRRLYEPIQIDSRNVANAAALKKLTQQRMKQISQTYKPEELKKQRFQMKGMLDKIGDDKITEQAMNLSDEKFNVLWNYGTFATDLSRDYERIELLATGGASAQQDRVHEDARQDIIDSLNWAESLPKTQATRRKR